MCKNTIAYHLLICVLYDDVYIWFILAIYVYSTVCTLCYCEQFSGYLTVCSNISGVISACLCSYSGLERIMLQLQLLCVLKFFVYVLCYKLLILCCCEVKSSFSITVHSRSHGVEAVVQKLSGAGI